jgi:hypothetical protein
LRDLAGLWDFFGPAFDLVLDVPLVYLFIMGDRPACKFYV